ncbi:MAG: hypothetical protein KF678_11875 [Phycisphaeraceae bacterium]|nr:hypothetical protein [Phycisphaeraceae bacterium]
MDIETDGMVAPEQLDMYKRGAGFGVNETRVVTPEGRMVRLSDTNGVWFEDDPRHGELRSRAMEVGETTPFLIARWFLDVGQRSQGWTVTEPERDVIRAEFPEHRCAFVLGRTSDRATVLIKLERWHAVAGSDPTVWTFADWSLIAPELPPVPRQRTLWVRDRDTGQPRESRVDRLVAARVIAPPPDSFFRLDLSRVRVMDNRTGEVRDAEGNVRGKVSLPRTMSAAGQWSVLLGSLGAGIVAVAALVWWWRRRVS